MKLESSSDTEYSCRKKKTKRERSLKIMLRMYLLQCWFNLSDKGVENAIYDSYVMQEFMEINFFWRNIPDSTTPLHFRHLLEGHRIWNLFLTPLTAA